MRTVGLSTRVLDLKELDRCRESERIEDHRGTEGYKYAYHLNVKKPWGPVNANELPIGAAGERVIPFEAALSYADALTGREPESCLPLEHHLEGLLRQPGALQEHGREKSIAPDFHPFHVISGIPWAVLQNLARTNR